MRPPGVDGLEGEHTIEDEERQPRRRERGEVAPRSLHRQDPRWLSGDRIVENELGRAVAATEVRRPLVRAEPA